MKQSKSEMASTIKTEQSSSSSLQKLMFWYLEEIFLKQVGRLSRCKKYKLSSTNIIHLTLHSTFIKSVLFMMRNENIKQYWTRGDQMARTST